MKFTGRIAAKATAIAVVGVVVGLNAAAPASALATASSYAFKANALGVSLGPIAVSSLPATPSASVVVLPPNPVFNGGVLTSSVTGDDSAGTSSATAGLESLSFSIPLIAGISVSSAQATCSIAGNGAVTAGASFASFAITGPLGNSLLTIPLNPAPNTVLGIPGVLTLTLNAQTDVGGVVTVDAAELDLLGGSVGSVDIGHAVCGPDAAVADSPIANPWVVLTVLAALGLGFAGYRTVRTDRSR